MATRKQLIAAGTGVAVVGILSYLGYRVFKQVNKFDFDFVGENLHDEYYFNTAKNRKGS
jgi:hypothetical protein